MFTIKHVTLGGETILQASEVGYINGLDTATTAAAAQQLMYLDGKEWKSVRFGVAYVMNDAGKTVATYDMNDQSNATAFGHAHGVGLKAA